MKVSYFVYLTIIFVFLENVNLTNGSAARADMSSVKVERASRRRRNVWQFGKIIQCVQNSESHFPWWAFTHLTDYGCFCGFGGQGQPVDDIDRCCYSHDKCYYRVRNKYNLWWWQVHLFSYDYSCSEGTAICGDTIPWKQKLCSCDVTAALCIKRHKEKYNSSYVDYNDVDNRCT
ncbi:basic phospholipase A2-like [Clavelina lepadiformis]|uniref:Phospholipase A2 n=1 Tax=Clavelina lepadiformis TaxID=159417 RepID=A0ABP0H0L3_CLALP